MYWTNSHLHKKFSQKQIEKIHEHVAKGEVDELEKIEDTRLLLSRNKDGVSPILHAATLGQLSVVNMLLNKVPQIVRTTDPVRKLIFDMNRLDSINQEGRGPLHWAFRCEDEEIREQMVSLLMSKGADKGLRDLVNIRIGSNEGKPKVE